MSVRWFRLFNFLNRIHCPSCSRTPSGGRLRSLTSHRDSLLGLAVYAALLLAYKAGYSRGLDDSEKVARVETLARLAGKGGVVSADALRFALDGAQ